MNLMCCFLFTLCILSAENLANLQIIQSANLEEFPYQAQIVTSEGTACSGIIISKNYIMTPATCIVEASSVKIFVGTKTKAKHLSKNILNTRGYNSSQFYFYGDDSTNREFKYDMGIISLPKPLEFSSVVQEVNINWDDEQLPPHSTLQIIGWYNTNAQFDLKKMQVKLAQETLCDYCYNVGETHKIILCFEQPENNYLDYPGNIIELNGRVLGYLTPGRNGGICNKLVPFLNIASFADWVKKKTGINTNTYDIRLY